MEKQETFPVYYRFFVAKCYTTDIILVDMPALVSIFLALLISTGDCIKCFVGNVTNPLPEHLKDCNMIEGIQREELYCRNITQITDGKRTVERECVAMSWFDATWESMGCHESSQGATKLIRCTCEKDLCNAESAEWMTQKQTSASSFIKSSIPIGLLAFLIKGCAMEVMLPHIS